MSKWQVYKDKKELPICCGVYVMYKDDKVIYVGISKNVRQRFTKHTIKDWDYVKMKPATTYGAAHDLESKLIKKIKPQLNSQGSNRMQLSTRHRLTVQPDIYQRFRTFCYSKNLKMKETLNQILEGFLDAAENGK
jgi:predicted GIY-YIG superfamily endonuclease